MSDPLKADPALPAGGSGVRVMIWYEGGGDTFFRISDRIACWLGRALPPGNIALATTAGADFLDLARARGNKVYPFKGPSGRNNKRGVLARLPANWVRFGRLLDEVRPDVVILVANFAPAWPLVRQIAARNIRLIYLPHDPKPHVGDYAPLWQSFSQTRVLNHADGLVLMSAAMRAEAHSLGGRFASLPARVVPLHTIGTPRVTAPRPLVEGRPIRFLFLGRLLAYKGLDLTAAACRDLAGRKDWSLVIAGQGPMIDVVKRDFAGFPQVDLSNLGHLSESAVDSLIANCDVMLCPYQDASQSGVVVEAALSAMPSIVTPVGALPEQVDHGKAGYLMEAVTGTALAATMRRVLDDRAALARTSAEVLDFWHRSVDRNAWFDAVQTILRAPAAFDTGTGERGA